jgi:dolichol-phosphate mannosyltransferase
VTHFFLILAYNEEQNLRRLLTSLADHVQTLHARHQVIVVDDGSDDRTAALAESFSGRLRLHVERHEANRGVAAGFRTGFDVVRRMAGPGDFVFTLEADNTVDLSQFHGMVEKAMQGADVVLGSCYAPGGRVEGVSPAREFMSRGINGVMRGFFPIPGCHTYSSFFRLYRSDVLQMAHERYGERFIESDGFTSAAEILFKVHRLGFRMAEVPTVLQFGERIGKSKMRVGRTILEYVRFLAREFSRRRDHKMTLVL